MTWSTHNFCTILAMFLFIPFLVQFELKRMIHMKNLSMAIIDSESRRQMLLPVQTMRGLMLIFGEELVMVEQDKWGPRAVQGRAVSIACGKIPVGSKKFEPQN